MRRAMVLWMVPGDQAGADPAYVAGTTSTENNGLSQARGDFSPGGPSRPEGSASRIGRNDRYFIAHRPPARSIPVRGRPLLGALPHPICIATQSSSNFG